MPLGVLLLPALDLTVVSQLSQLDAHVWEKKRAFHLGGTVKSSWQDAAPVSIQLEMGGCSFFLLLLRLLFLLCL